MKFFMALFVFLLLCVQTHAVEFQSLGLVGDSGITGAVADPKLGLSFSIDSLGGRVLDIVKQPQLDYRPSYELYSDPTYFNIKPGDNLWPPLRIFYHPSEVEREDTVKVNLESWGSVKLDLEQYSFGYLVGRKLGLEPDHIVMAAQDGKKVKTVFEQFKRLSIWSSYKTVRAWTPSLFSLGQMTAKVQYHPQPEILPELVLVSYTGNDMCRLEVLEFESGELYRRYYDTLVDNFLRVTSELEAPDSGTDIYVLSALDVLQTLTNESILSRPVKYHDRELTCGDLRGSKRPKIALLGQKDIYRFTEGGCRSVLGTELDDHDRVKKLHELRSEIVQAQSDVAEFMNKQQVPGFRFHFIKSVGEIKFSGEDIANDCHHPSLFGHEKIARKVLEFINKKP